MADVNLVINMNFFIERVDRDGSENRTDIDKDGLPSDTKSTSTYADLFYLTARLRGLGLLIGPGTWTLNFWLHENEDNALRVTVARQPRRNIKLEQYLRIPFKFSPETSLCAYVDWKLVEEMIEEAGAEKEFKKFVNGTIYKERLRGYSSGNPPPISRTRGGRSIASETSNLSQKVSPWAGVDGQGLADVSLPLLVLSSASLGRLQAMVSG
jgi:hypothetical protein